MKKADVVDQVTHAATHPISTAAYAFGLARGIAAAVIRAASDVRKPQVSPVGGDVAREAVEPETSGAPRRTDDQQVAPARQLEPVATGEAFVTEPSAVSRASARGGRGNDAELDDWRGDAELAIDPAADPAADSVVEALERGDLPGGDQVDRAAMASVLSEATRQAQGT